jgi:SAM-dependent methyltransferase
MDIKELQLAHHKPNQTRHPWELARLELLTEWLKRSLSGPGPVLDVGCGDGFVLSSVSELFGRPGYGVDSAWEPDLVPLPPQVQIVSSLDSLPPHIGEPAAVLLMDVLEHLESPGQLLSELTGRGLIRPGTRVYVTVPAFQQLFSRHDEFLGHYRRYSRSELERLLRRNGLEPLYSGYVFSGLLLVRLLQCLKERAGLTMAPPVGVAEWRGGPRLTAFIARVLCWDAHLAGYCQEALGLTIPGLSCYAVCQLTP